MPSSFLNAHTLAAVDENGVGLAVEFFKAGDRYAHRVRTIRGNRPSEDSLLESFEGGDEIWPPSPALQELSVTESASGDRALLLVGMAGKSHWSLSIHADGSALLFDVACRCVAAPLWLGSTYVGESAARIESESLIVIANSEIRIAAPAATNYPATIRWRYHVSMG